MSMKRYKLYNTNKAILISMLGLGSVSLIYGIIKLIQIIGGASSFSWESQIYTLQGILFTVLGMFHLRTRKYFIEWDDVQMNYLFPGNKTVETIVFSEIQDVTIKLFEVKLQLKDSEKTINLENLQFKEIRMIKDKFEELKLATEKMPVSEI